jgi:hypothetical protein
MTWKASYPHSPCKRTEALKAAVVTVSITELNEVSVTNSYVFISMNLLLMSCTALPANYRWSGGSQAIWRSSLSQLRATCNWKGDRLSAPIFSLHFGRQSWRNAREASKLPVLHTPEASLPS